MFYAAVIEVEVDVFGPEEKGTVSQRVSVVSSIDLGVSPTEGVHARVKESRTLSSGVKKDPL